MDPPFCESTLSMNIIPDNSHGYKLYFGDVFASSLQLVGIVIAVILVLVQRRQAQSGGRAKLSKTFLLPHFVIQFYVSLIMSFLWAILTFVPELNEIFSLTFSPSNLSPTIAPEVYAFVIALNWGTWFTLFSFLPILLMQPGIGTQFNV